MAFFTSAVGVLKTLVIALGAGLGIWGVVVDIALIGKLSPVFQYRVPPVFLVLEIFLCFFGQLQFVQLVNKVKGTLFLCLLRNLFFLRYLYLVVDVLPARIG